MLIVAFGCFLLPDAAGESAAMTAAAAATRTTTVANAFLIFLPSLRIRPGMTTHGWDANGSVRPYDPREAQSNGHRQDGPTQDGHRQDRRGAGYDARRASVAAASTARPS